MRRRAFVQIGFAAATAGASAQTRVDKFPSRGVRIVVPYGAGTSTDLSARVLAEGLTKVWDQPVTVENVPAASGTVGTDQVAKLPPDGHTLVMVASNHVINPFLYTNLAFDALKDFTPICMVGRTQIVLVVSSQSDIHDVPSLIKKAKAAPGRLNYGSAGNGSVGQLLAEQLKRDMGMSITHIPYRTQGQALTDLLGGQVDLALPALGVALPFLRNGKLRAIGLANATRSALAPDIPTIQEQTGRPLDGLAWWGLLGPRNMPADLVATINSAVRSQLQSPAGLERMRGIGSETVASSPQEMADIMAADYQRIGQIVKAAGIKID